MKKTVFAIALCLLLCASSLNAAEVYLKNGSVIKNVSSYEKADGKIIFNIHGGTFEIEEKDILRIDDKKVPEPPKETLKQIEPEVKQPPSVSSAESEMIAKRRGQLKKRLIEIEEKLGKIKDKENELQNLNKEYDNVRLRIEVLFQQGTKGASKAGKDISQWLYFLTPQEREWVQVNTIRKKKLEKDMEAIKKELEPMLEDKGTLLKEKEETLQELSKTSH